MGLLTLVGQSVAIPGKEECVARLNTFKGCPSNCVGSCYQLVFDGCHDCVEGDSACDPPAGPCWSWVEKANCVGAQGGCQCGAWWPVTERTQASNGCS